MGMASKKLPQTLGSQKKLAISSLANNAFKVDRTICKQLPSGSLVCLLCNAPVKTPKFWTAHVNGREHRMRLLALKHQKEQTLTQCPALPADLIIKRKLNSSEEVDVTVFKKVKKASELLLDRTIDQVTPSVSGLPSNFFDGKSKESSHSYDSSSGNQSQRSKSTKATVKNGVLCADSKAVAKRTVLGDYDESSLSSDEAEGIGDSPKKPNDTKSLIGFHERDESMEVDDSLEGDSAASLSVPKDSSKPKSTNPADILPEGFFDDRVMDAKVRGVELKDPMEKEMAKFEKEVIQAESQASEAIAEEDEEEFLRERLIDEIDEQIQDWGRVDQLDRQLVGAVLGNDSSSVFADREPTSSSEDFDLDSAVGGEEDDLWSWRSKGTS